MVVPRLPVNPNPGTTGLDRAHGVVKQWRNCHRVRRRVFDSRALTNAG